MKKYLLTVTVLIMTLFSAQAAYGAERLVTVSIPDFPVTLNEVRYDNNDYALYPLLVYKDITYFPMTYFKSNLMNLNTSWTESGGLVIERGNPETPKEFQPEEQGRSYNKRTQTAYVVGSKVTVNGKVIDNQNEQYPLLRFRDITYFPLTWRFAVDEFGWSYIFDNADGLDISADNYYYVYSGYNLNSASTTYKKGALTISMTTGENRLGLMGWNLHIIKNEIEIQPLGYFGYFHQEKGPLFTVEGNYIYTTFFPIDYSSYDIFMEGLAPEPCRVSIDTSEIN